MANRVNLYSLSNRPTSYADRPETVSGLADWAWDVPFSFYALTSGDPQRCASLLTDGLYDDDSDDGDGDGGASPPKRTVTNVYAVSGTFEAGFARLKRFLDVVRVIGQGVPYLAEQIDETSTFLAAHQDAFLLLETIEVDSMSSNDEAKLVAMVDDHVEKSRRVGAAIDALPDDIARAAELVKASAQKRAEPPFDVFYGMRFDKHFDNIVDDKTENPIGLANWTTSLEYELWNRAEYEAPTKG